MSPIARVYTRSMGDEAAAAEGDDYRYIRDTEEGSNDHALFRALHTTRLPQQVVYTEDRTAQVAQARWLLAQGLTLQSWSLAQFYWDEQAPLGTFVKNLAPERLMDVADSMQANPITRTAPM